MARREPVLPQSVTRRKLEELLDRIPCLHYPKSCPSDYLFPEPTETADLSEEQIEGIAAKLAELKASALKAYTPIDLISELMSRTDCKVIQSASHLNLESNEFLVVLPEDTSPYASLPEDRIRR